MQGRARSLNTMAPARAQVSPASAGSHTYRLKFPDEDGRPAKDIEFHASDSSEALAIAQREARSRFAEMWCDGRKLCTIRRNAAGYWEVSAQEAARLPYGCALD